MQDVYYLVTLRSVVLSGAENLYKSPRDPALSLRESWLGA